MVKFIMLVGLPGSGKSTYAEELKEKGYIIHSSDAIREELGDINDQSKNEEVFRILHKRIKNDLKADKDVCYDACNISRKRRIAFLKELGKIPCEKIGVLIATPFEECCKQNNKRDRRVPVEVIWRMYKNFNMPCVYEEFDWVNVYYPKKNWEEYYGEIEKYVRILCNFGQDNHHHTLTLGNHMLAAMFYVLHMNGGVYDEIALAALSHDIGKVETKAFINSKGERDSEAHYFSHNCVGSYESLFFEYPFYVNKEYIALLIELHMKPYLEWKQSENAFRKDKELFGETIIRDLELVHKADLYSH